MHEIWRERLVKHIHSTQTGISHILRQHYFLTGVLSMKMPTVADITNAEDFVPSH